VGVQVKLKSHTWALLRWWVTTKRRYIKCMHIAPLPLPYTSLPFRSRTILPVTAGTDVNPRLVNMYRW